MAIRDSRFIRIGEDLVASTLLIKDIETGNLVVTTEANLGPVANVIITGGSNGESLLTDGAGNLSFGVPSRANTANTANTVTDAAQPNITSVGNLSSLTVGGNAVVGGNLTVGGNISYTNITQLVVEDPIIELGTGPNGNALTTNDGKDRGTLLRTFSSGANAEVNRFMGWDASGAEFIMASNASVSNGIVAINTFGNVHADHFIGNGSSLVSLTGANVTGTVANATYAVSAGSANTANSVSVANVSGIGNVATLNLNGNVNTFLRGNGTFGSIPTGALNYSQTLANAPITITSVPSTVISTSLTTNGNPVQITVYGDAVGYSASMYAQLRLYRNDTALGRITWVEASAAHENQQFSLSVIDAPPAGAYSYSLRMTEKSGQNIIIGETDGPVIYAIELQNVKGDTGATGPSANTFLTVAANGTNLVANSSNATLTLSSGNNISITGNASSNTVTIGLTGTVANANYAAYAGNVTIAAQANITTVGTLGNLSVTANTTTSNLTVTGNAVFGPQPLGNYYTPAPISLTATQTGGVKTQLNLMNEGGGGGAGAAIDFYTYTAGGNNPEARITAIDNADFAAYVSIWTKQPWNDGYAPMQEVARFGTDKTTSLYGNANVAGYVLSGNVTLPTSSVTSAGLGYVAQPGGWTGHSLVVGNGTGKHAVFTHAANTAWIGVEDGANANSLAELAKFERANLLSTFTNVEIRTSLTTADFRATGNTTLGNIPSGAQYTPAPLNLTKSLGGGLKTQLNLVNEGGGSGAGSAIDFYTYTGQGNGVPGSRISAVDDGNYSSNVSIWTKTTGNVGNGTLVEAIRVTNARNLIVYGNATANFFIGSGNNLSDIQGANVSGAVANATYAVSAGTSGTVTTAAQPNITSVGTLANLISNGTVNFTGASNVSLGAVGNVKITGGSNGQALITNGNGTLSWGNVAAGDAANAANANYANFAGSVTTAAQGNITSVGTLTGLTVSGTTNLGAVGNVKVSGGSNGQVLTTNGNGTLSWANAGSGSGNANNIVSGTSNVNIASANANVTVGVAGNSIATFTDTGANIAGTANITGNTAIGGNLTVGGKTNVGPAGNLVVTGGSSGQSLTTDGSGNLSWSMVGPGVSEYVAAIRTGGYQTNVGTDTDLIFNTVVSSSGSIGSTYNTGTSVWTLTAGKTYELYASIITADYTQPSQGYCVTQWVFAANNASVLNQAEGGASLNRPLVSSANESTNGITRIYYTPSADVSVKLRVTGAFGTCSLRDNGSTAIVRQIGSSSITGNVTIGGGGTSNISGNLGISSNLTVVGTTNVGAVGNLVITGGSNGQVLTTNGNGTLSWGDAGNATAIVNGNSNVIVTANGNVSTSVGGTANVFVVTTTGANVTGNVNVSGNITVNGAPIYGVPASYVKYYSNVRQSAVTNAQVVFESLENSSGSDITVNTSTGSITLAAGRTYRLRATTGLCVPTSGQAAWILSQWFNHTTGGYIGASAIVFAPNYAGNRGYYPGTGEAIITTTETTVVSYRMAQINNGSAIILEPGQEGQSAWCDIEVIGGQAPITGFTTTGNISGGNIAITGTTTLGSVGNLVITGGSNGQALITNGNGVLTWGNVAAGDAANAANANYANYAGNAFSVSGSNVSGTVANATYATTAGSADTANTANLATFATTANSVAGSNVSGTVANATYAASAGTVTTAAQGNITSVGTLTGLTVSGTTNLGAVGNVVVTGGSSGQVLMTNGSGGLSWANMVNNGTQTITGTVNPTIVSNVSPSSGTINGGSNSSPGKIILTLVLPTAGTWQLTSALRISYGGWVAAAFYLNGTLIPNSEQWLFESAAYVSQYGGVLSSIVTVNAGDTVTVGAWSSTNSSSPINSGDGRCVVSATLLTAPISVQSSVGTMTSLSVSGTTTLGPVGNVSITGGSNGQALITNGNGVLTWGNVAAGDAANAANANYANYAGNAFSVSGSNVSGTVANATYAASAGSSDTANTANTANLATYATTANAVAGANVSGWVANANIANLATYATTANAVAGANVSGTVANATYASSSDTANTANTANLATFATTANAVAGANVSGWVANANIANIAYSVDAANITGTVANATYATSAGSSDTANTANLANLATFATTANAVSGANVSGTVANATYADTANIANTAYSVALANVTGITSYSQEFHVDPNGDDTTGTGSVLRPYRTIQKAVDTSAAQATKIVVHPGGYYESVTMTDKPQVSLISSATAGIPAPSTPAIYGNLTVSGNSTGIAISGISVMETITHSSSGSLYLVGLQLGSSANVGTLNKTGAGYLALMDVNGATGVGANLTSVSITGNGPVTMANVNLRNLTVNNASTSVSVTSGSTLLNTTHAAGTLNLFDTFLYANASNTAALTSTSTGGVLQIRNSAALTPTNTLGRINVGAATVLAYGDLAFDRANSNVGYSANITVDFQSLRAANTMTATLFSGSGASLTALPGANVTGTVANATSATTASTVTSNAQANITSVGTLTSLTVSGNLTVNGKVSANSAYGMFWNSANIANPGANTAAAITWNAQDGTNGISYSGSNVTISRAGAYNVQFNAQVNHPNGGQGSTVYFWMKMDGVDVPGSGGSTFIAAGSRVIQSWNSLVTANANSVLQLYWASDAADITLIAYANTAWHPSIPSALITVTPVGA